MARTLHDAYPVLASIQRHSAALGDSYEAVEERGVAARLDEKRVPSFRFLLDRNPSDNRLRISDREIPDIAVTFVQKVANHKSMCRQIVHVVAERPPAHHDRSSIAMPEQ